MPSSLVGNKELLLKLTLLAKDGPVAAAFGLYEGMQKVMIVAKDNCPRDTDRMVKSGYVDAPEVIGGRVFIDTGFGGGSEDYVVRNHEDMSLNHPRGGTAKWFERALDSERGVVLQTLSDHMAAFHQTGKTTFVRLNWEGLPIPQSPFEQPVGPPLHGTK